ncbi:MAG: AraC family transcriptional regulator [Gammaproteobacteria bacterium]|nr:AraC family transcriptional regulator [Gammaproteobacteria bacterium]
MLNKFTLFFLISLFFIAMSPITVAENSVSPKALDSEIQSLKDEVLKLNRDLFILEEELLFPVNTQITVFVSVDVGEFFTLDSVQLTIDDTQIANYLYTESEADALRRGGVQQLHIGNIRHGSHKLTAFFTGKGPNERDYSRAATTSINKTNEPKYVELKIVDLEKKQQPSFDIRVWEPEI